jgi:hypothetical protein
MAINTTKFTERTSTVHVCVDGVYSCLMRPAWSVCCERKWTGTSSRPPLPSASLPKHSVRKAGGEKEYGLWQPPHEALFCGTLCLCHTEDLSQDLSVMLQLYCPGWREQSWVDLFGSVCDLSSPRVAILFSGGVSSFPTLSSPDFFPLVTFSSSPSWLRNHLLWFALLLCLKQMFLVLLQNYVLLLCVALIELCFIMLKTLMWRVLACVRVCVWNSCMWYCVSAR